MKNWLIVIIFGFALFICMNIVLGDVIINEVMPKPASTYEEWVELYNNDSSDLTLSNWIIGDNSSNDTFSLNISANGFALILDDYLNCSSFNIPNESCIEVPNIGNALSDSDSLFLYDNNSVLISNFSWTSAQTNISWQFCNSSWLNCTPTPGLENNCTQICSQSTACSNSSCSSSIITQTCITTYSNCSNATSYQNFSCSSEEDIYIELEWNEDDIVNGDDFEITVNAYNLEDEDYDIKVWIEDEDDNAISERYGIYSDDDDKTWKAGTYYANDFFSGDGDESDEIKIRIKSSYDDFEGDATIYAKIRSSDDEDEKDSWDDDIEVLEAEDSSSSSSSGSTTSSATTSSNTASASNAKSGTISLGGNNSANNTLDEDNSIIYKSATEYIKEYAPYAFSAFCIVILVLLLRNKL